jgi:parallel beta-helix repeat protein
MSTLTNFDRSVALVVLLFATALLPPPVEAQPALAVSPTSVTVQANTGANATSQTVQVSNAGSRALKWSIEPPGASWLSVSPTSGTNSGTLTLTFATSALPAGQHQTSFRVQSTTGSAITINVQASLLTSALPPPPPTGGLKDPQGNVWTFGAGGQTLRNAIHFGGGYGTEYRLCNDIVHVLGTAALWYRVSASGGWWESVGATFPCDVPQPPPPPSTSAVGPQSTITCPAGAVDIWPGVSVQTIVDSYGGNTTFCLRAGTHFLRSSITPKTGNTFVGEYGAILDGTGWSTSDDTQAAFRAHNQDIDYVTIRNLVIRNMPQRGIHAVWIWSDHWTVEYNEIASSQNTGIVLAPDSLIRNNYIHHNAVAGYMGPYAHNTTLDSNEIAYNGDQNRVRESNNVTFRNNFVHHNAGVGIWYDSNNTGALIEGNRVEDNGWIGINYEVSFDAIIRNNTIRRNAEAGVFLSVSKNVQIYNNTLEHNFRGITYYLRCASIGGPTNFDLTNTTAHDNTITVGTQSGAFASVFSYSSDCTSTQVAPYLNGSKNLTFSRNTYHVPSPTTGRYWIWGFIQLKYWNEWQAIPQDATGTMSQ